MGIVKQSIGKLVDLFSKAEEVRAELPLHMRPEIDDISKTLPQYGPHKLRKKGPGTDYFDIRPFDPQADDPRGIHARHSRRHDKLMFVEKESEIRHHFYMWRDGSGSMNWKSDKAPFTPREASEIMMMALAKYLTKYQEKVGMLETGRVTQSTASSQWIATQLEISKSAGDTPEIVGRLTPDSSALLFSDFMGDPEKFTDMLARLQSRRISGWVVMVEDPEIFNFDFSKNSIFEGLEGEASFTDDLGDGKDYRKLYHVALLERIDLIKATSENYGFKFIVQRTDLPLHHALHALFGLQDPVPDYVEKLRL